MSTDNHKLKKNLLDEKEARCRKGLGLGSSSLLQVEPQILLIVAAAKPGTLKIGLYSVFESRT